MGGVVKFVVGVALLAYGVATANLAIAKAGFYLANLGILEEVSKLFTPRVKRPGLRTDVEYFGTIEPRRIIYGEMKASGLNCLRPVVTGANGEFLHQVLAIAGHQCESLTDVYFNQTTIASANMTAITGAATDGKVTTGAFANKAWVRRYVGTTTQTADWILTHATALWPATSRGKNTAYLALQYELDEEVYASGKPDVSVLVRGKICYDPRLDTSPGANPTSSAYKAWTRNPALQLQDYLRDTNLGCGIASGKLDWDLVVAAADICDETGGIDAAPAQKRYTSNVVLFAALTAQQRNENIAILAGAMMGVCYRQGGKWRMYAGAEQTPSFALTHADIVGPYTLRREVPMGEKYNFVRGQYVDASRDYQLVDFQPRSDAGYEVDDGARLPREVEFAACTNEYESQRNAIVLLRQSRLTEVVTLTCGMSAFKVLPFAVGTATIDEFGWANKRVQCIGWNFNPTGTVDLTLREDSTTVWDDPASGEYTAPGSAGTDTPGTYVPRPPSGLTAIPAQGGILFRWTAPTSFLASDTFELYEHTAATPFSSATRIWQGRATSALIEKDDTTTRYYWVRTRASNQRTSSTNPASSGVAGKAGPAATGLRGYPSGDGTVEHSGSTASLTTPSTTITATGGTAPYSYAWTKLSGGTITATAASSATSAFNAASMASGETRSATFRCTVTDNVAATATVDVPVTITRIGFTVTVTPAGLVSTGSSGSQTTATTTATPAGGVASYSYAWTTVTSDAGITINSPSAATTSFSVTGLPVDGDKGGTFRCTVTDSTGGTPLTASDTVNVSFLRFS